jgi:hypothetical protein
MNAGKLNVGGILDIAQLLNSWTNIPAAVAAVVGTLKSWVSVQHAHNERRGSTARAIDRKPAGSAWQPWAQSGHKPAQSKRIASFVIPQVNGGARR